jgi:hypothetical protein
MKLWWVMGWNDDVMTVIMDMSCGSGGESGCVVAEMMVEMMDEDGKRERENKKQ